MRQTPKYHQLGKSLPEGLAKWWRYDTESVPGQIRGRHNPERKAVKTITPKWS